MQSNKQNIKLMYITNNLKMIQNFDSLDIDYLFIDLETLGKEERQRNMDTVKSRHCFDDIKNARPFIKKAKILVRINHFNKNTKEEVETAIKYGADAIMLPMFETNDEVQNFISFVNKKAETILLLETIKAVDNIDSILKTSGIDRIHIGLNDLHIQKHQKFMFELLCDGTIEQLANKINDANIPFGFGGVSRIGNGTLPATKILAEHCRLNSSSVILSRDFCDLRKMDTDTAIKTLKEGVRELRLFYKQLSNMTNNELNSNLRDIKSIVNNIVGSNYV